MLRLDYWILFETVTEAACSVMYLYFSVMSIGKIFVVETPETLRLHFTMALEPDESFISKSFGGRFLHESTPLTSADMTSIVVAIGLSPFLKAFPPPVF